MSKKLANCDHCDAELRATFIYAYTVLGLGVQPGFECPKCHAIYDVTGGELEGSMSSHSDDDDTDSDGDQ